MPEVFVTTPSLQIPSENCSETENSSVAAEVTDRSSDSPNDNANCQMVLDKKLKPMESQSKIKLRKSHARRSHKKSLIKTSIGCSQQKTTSTLKLKSHIPRALQLTPSSSSTSLTTSDSLPSPLIPAIKTLTEERILETKTSTRSCLVRQKSGLILAFRQRKSISQMDFKHARQQMNFPIPSSHTLLNNNSEDSKALITSRGSENMTVTYHKNSFVHKMYNQDNYYAAIPQRDPQIAGLRIFATIMLNAWRKRRDEVKHLLDEVADLKRGAIKAKNQLHVFNTLFRVEQKRNDELNCQLKKLLDDINLTKSSCESLTTSVISVKADKALLEQQLQIKEQEFENLNTLLAQTKSDLFKNMTLQRELQASLSMEQRQIQILENQKNELINEICEVNCEALQTECDLRKEIEEKVKELSELQKKLKEAEEEIKTINQSSELKLSASKASEERMKLEIEALEYELKMLQKCLQETLSKRLKSYWNNYVTYQKLSVQMLHWLAFIILPAMPPPKNVALPFSLSLDKALSVIKR